MNVLPVFMIYFLTKSAYFVCDGFFVFDNTAYHINTVWREINDLKLYTKRLVKHDVRIHTKEKRIKWYRFIIRDNK